MRHRIYLETEDQHKNLKDVGELARKIEDAHGKGTVADIGLTTEKKTPYIEVRDENLCKTAMDWVCKFDNRFATLSTEPWVKAVIYTSKYDLDQTYGEVDHIKIEEIVEAMKEKGITLMETPYKLVYSDQEREKNRKFLEFKLSFRSEEDYETLQLDAPTFQFTRMKVRRYRERMMKRNPKGDQKNQAKPNTKTSKEFEELYTKASKEIQEEIPSETPEKTPEETQTVDLTSPDKIAEEKNEEDEQSRSEIPFCASPNKFESLINDH